jgi:hypothetical protein
MVPTQQSGGQHPEEADKPWIAWQRKVPVLSWGCCRFLLLLLDVFLQAMIAQVSHDHALLAERIARLTGPDASARLEAALAHVRQQVAAELQAADDAASEASWETTSEAGR